MGLPDEDAFALTADQLAAAAPRRGGRSARPFTMRPADTEWWRFTGVEQRREPLLTAAAHPETDLRIGAALRYYLGGEPDPLGAAAAFTVDDAVGTSFWRDSGYCQYDAWLGEHGAEFAASAVMAYFAVTTVHRVLYGLPDRGGAPVPLTAVPDGPARIPWRSFGRELLRLRTHLSTMPEAQFRTIEAVLESNGRNPVQRAVRAYLVPGRTDWVDTACAERAAGLIEGHESTVWLLRSVGSTAQLAAAGLLGHRFDALSRAHDHCSLLDGVGPDCAPLLLAASLAPALGDSEREALHDVLATLPRDDAVRFFLQHIETHRTWDRLQRVADRFPVRTLRAVAALTEDADTAQLARFIGLIRSHPVLDGPARDALDPADRNRVDALLAWRGHPPETADVPAALAAPPHGRRGAPWAAMVTATPVLTKGRRARLPQAAVEHLLAALALDTARDPHPAVEAAVAHCDPASLREFSWAVFATWNGAGDRANPWAFTQLARFADDATVRRLEALVHEWPGRSLHKRAVRGLELLGAIGTEEALSAVHRISRQASFKGLKKAAASEVDRIAARLGLDQEQLLDRLVPDVELDADGRMALDFGPRSFTVGFDEQLKPYVIDPKGKARRSLPRPAAGDDPEAAAAAAARFDRLKRGLKSVGTEQVGRLERAMTGGRVWSRSDFERFVAGHALMRHLARRLVWQYTTGRGWTAFRIAEDGGYADVRDDVLRLPERAAVRLPHPLHLGAETAAWAQLLTDYEVVQPFEQLARPVFTLTREEAATGRIARFEGRTVATGPLLGLQRARGWWQYTHVFSGAGAPLGLCREIRDRGWFMLGLSPGIDPADPGAAPHQTLNTVRFTAEESADADAPRDLDPLLASELLALLDRHTVR
ncbi:protein of unknown function [Glycomyces sambucus]|uniref:DUF4132 domain-containing protein n=1 Tax=Glycomyces sambucus TaxID=380244 RepID=A0A1G9IJP2_9ACTN|nr:DUF4132 domain-containing protein [Glycomyces sambucus]SDL25306.1 protein of unknown function [Glycomyces sambucus]